MGHQKIGALPKSANWREVVALLANGADVNRIASATFKASDKALKEASSDPAVSAVFFLLAQLPVAARASDPAAALADIGVEVGQAATVAELCSAMVTEADRRIATVGSRSDLAELAVLSAGEALYGALSDRTVDMFDGRSAMKALQDLRTVKNFGDLTKAFLSRLLRRSLDYYLGRDLPNHVGSEHRFTTVHDHLKFDDAFARHCAEVAEITREYAGGWYSKTLHEETMSPKTARGALAYAFDKISRELAKR